MNRNRDCFGAECLKCGSLFRHDQYQGNDQTPFICPVCGSDDAKEVRVYHFLNYPLIRSKHKDHIRQYLKRLDAEIRALLSVKDRLQRRLMDNSGRDD